jgi:hypothetical protein
VLVLKKLLIAVLVFLTLSMPIGVKALPPSRAQAEGQALLISSLNATSPMGQYAHDVVYYLERVGYNVTYLTDGAFTVDFLLNHLNQYSIVIWRTNTFTWVHTTYWFVGEKMNDGVEQEYAADFAAGWINDNTGIVGVSPDFFLNHLGPNSLNNIKLMIFMASDGNSLAPQFLTAGVSTVIYCNGNINLAFGLVDDLSVQILAYLTQGQDVYTAVYATVSPLNQYEQPEDNLDTTYAPPFWFTGNATLTITSVIAAAGPIPRH